MSNQLDDFLISLGFDTSKIKSQVAGLEKTLNQVAGKAAKQQEVAAKKVVKQKLSDEMIVQRAIEKRQKKELKREEDLAKVRKKNNIALTSESSKTQSARRVQAVKQLTNKEANPQLKAMGKQYQQLQSSGIGTAILRRRQRRDVNTFRNLQAYQRLKEFDKGSEERKLLTKILLQARQDSKANRKEKLTRDRARLRKIGDDYERRGRFAATSMDVKQYAATQVQSALANNQIGKQFSQALQGQLAKARTKTDVDRTIGTVGRISRMNGADPRKVMDAENVEQLKRYGEQLKRNNAELNAAARRSFGLAAAQGSLRDSTRNLVREYASLYALFAGTVAIKESAKAMDGVVAGMTAVSDNSVELAHNLQFIKDESLKNGLAVGEAAKAYVKLKAAIGDKKSLEETEQMFQSLTKAGVVFQLSQDDMSGVIKAVSQMFAKGKIQAEEFKYRLAA